MEKNLGFINRESSLTFSNMVWITIHDLLQIFPLFFSRFFSSCGEKNGKIVKSWVIQKSPWPCWISCPLLIFTLSFNFLIFSYIIFTILHLYYNIPNHYSRRLPSFSSVILWLANAGGCNGLGMLLVIKRRRIVFPAGPKVRSESYSLMKN